MDDHPQAVGRVVRRDVAAFEHLGMNEAERAEVGNTKSEVRETRLLASRRSER
jgi:hypothetical protein